MKPRACLHSSRSWYWQHEAPTPSSQHVITQMLAVHVAWPITLGLFGCLGRIDPRGRRERRGLGAYPRASLSGLGPSWNCLVGDWQCWQCQSHLNTGRRIAILFRAHPPISVKPRLDDLYLLGPFQGAHMAGSVPGWRCLPFPIGPRIQP